MSPNNTNEWAASSTVYSLTWKILYEGGGIMSKVGFIRQTERTLGLGTAGNLQLGTEQDKYIVFKRKCTAVYDFNLKFPSSTY